MGGAIVQRDIGGGRGWLEDEAAKSQARIDHALGHQQQITEAGRSWDQQNEHYQRYLRFLNGGPWAPIALDPNTPSVHQKGRAKDTNERVTALLNDHGWFHTVYRNGVLVEPWHYEYFPERDNHRHEPVVLVRDADGVYRYHVQEDDMNDDQDRRLKAVEADVKRLAKSNARIELGLANAAGTNFYKHDDLPKGHNLWIYVTPSGDFVRIRDVATARLYKERNGGRLATPLSGDAIRSLVADLTAAGGRDLSAVPNTTDAAPTVTVPEGEELA
jgi:hypothetical protein